MDGGAQCAFLPPLRKEHLVRARHPFPLIPLFLDADGPAATLEASAAELGRAPLMPEMKERR
jgi:hypothetical protein